MEESATVLSFGLKAHLVIGYNIASCCLLNVLAKDIKQQLNY